jgi:hypothetical protein
MSDGVFTAVDTGGAVISRTAARRAGRTTSERNAIVIDRFFETRRQALAWAKAHPAFMRVQVFPPAKTGRAQAPAVELGSRADSRRREIAAADERHMPQ